jgi:hypothetical protein
MFALYAFLNLLNRTILNVDLYGNHAKEPPSQALLQKRIDNLSELDKLLTVGFCA